MKKWIDDLYAILLRRGFITLDNVLKKYKTEIEDYEEMKINDELITLGPQESIVIDMLPYFNTYDRFMLFNRGEMSFSSFIMYFYKSEFFVSNYFTNNDTSNKIGLSHDGNRSLTILNRSSSVLNFNLYIKKIC